MSTVFENPTNYGRIIRESDNSLKCIVEEKDATAEQKAVKEVNAGIYCLNWGKIKDAFSQLQATTHKENTILQTLLPGAKRTILMLMPIFLKTVMKYTELTHVPT